MLENIKDYLFPKSVEAAVRRMNQGAPGSAIPFTGSIDLVYPLMTQASTLLDISRLGLDKISQKGKKIHIGGTASFQQIVESPLLKDCLKGMLPLSAKLYASRNQRNITNLQDTIISGTNYFDLLTVLVLLEAKVHLHGKSRRILSLEKALENGVGHGVGDEIIREVSFDKPRGRWKSSLQRVAVLESDLSILSVAVMLKGTRRKCSEIKIALGSGLHHPCRFPEIENSLVGKPLNPGSLEQAGKAIAKGIDPLDDVRGSEEYRREMAAVLFVKAVEDCLKKGDAAR
jgi:CO/xanthine dehydrogenase FAD-binding subunit